MAEAQKQPESAACESISNSEMDAIEILDERKDDTVEVENSGLLSLISASVEELRSSDIEEETGEAMDECSPTGVLEDCIRSAESEVCSANASTSYSEAAAIPCVAQWRGFLRQWKQRSIKNLYTFPPFIVPKLTKKGNRSTRVNIDETRHLLDDADLCCLKPSWKNFTFAELKTSTNNFSSDNVIGKGGYGEVYKGCLQDGQLVAIKRLTRGSAEERISDFLSELGIIVHVNHPNAAKLVGFGVEGGMHLVLQLSPNGSLATLLHGSKDALNWSIRYKVAVGTAQGLHYLHEHCQRRIIHRDIKASNILLTEDFEPQICDFGLAKWLPDQWTHHTVSKFEGTFGYLAPEYFMHGIVDEKTDVFAFGVLLLELITGRKALDSSQQSLLLWAKPLLDKSDIRELADPALGDAYDSQQMSLVAMAASLCIQQSSILRPPISQVVQLLKGEGSPECAKLAHMPTIQRTYSEELLDLDEYNSTKYLNDLNRHRQLAMEF
ncbi:hypothetical protein AAC387_Pa10g1138 [Persea americana]|eukprot:TRINITY_DN14976_c0_g1_i1.p1 TRINITY_DN14976_c0_g1~~TRINITY_DN14976_c0_g1_i1.p1  ORF type:complete len:495 (-),score=99.70 TRINITY_DN14976_c0_g1_i1:362-1846(-)